MRVSVYDTYVQRIDGRTMHFDILVPESISKLDAVLSFGRQYLQSKGEAGQLITATECSFCHAEDSDATVRSEIEANGYAIIELEDC